MTEYKLVIVGGGGVGKSACTLQLISNNFVACYDPTIEDSYQKQVIIDDEACLLNILDTNGQGLGLLCNAKPIYTNGQGFMCCYAINNRTSFDEIQNDFYPLILQVNEKEWVPAVFVGNKCDLETERQVTTADGEELARRYKTPFFETSALRCINIEEAFFSLVREVRKTLVGNIVNKNNKKDEKKLKCKLV
jgi:GTPase KRas protein